MSPAPLAAVSLLLLPPIFWCLKEAHAAYTSSTGTHSHGRLALGLLAVLLYAEYTLIYTLIYTLRYHLRARAAGCASAAKWPHKDPVLGLDVFIDSIHAIRRNALLRRFKERFDECGARTYWARNLGQDVIMTDEPENVRAIMGGPDGHENWLIAGPRLYGLLPALGSNSIFTTNGGAWFHSRSVIRPSFVRDQIADLEVFGKHVGNLIERIRGLGGETFDFQALLQDMTMDSSTDFLLGHSTNMLKNPTDEVRTFVRAFERASQMGAQRALLGSLAFIIPNRELDNHVKTIQDFVGRYMDRAAVALAASEKHRDSEFEKKKGYLFLKELLKADAPKEYVRDQVLSIIIAGRDTTAMALSSVFYYLAKNPRCLEKCRQEIVELGTEDPSWEQLRNMKYLNNCIREALRLVPPIGTNSRQSSKEVILPRGGGKDGKSPILVPKGTQARFPSYSMHRRKDLYGEDAEEFRPERWEDLRVTWEYVPFSAGARICLGQQFAMTQMAFTILRVLQNFKTIESMDDGPEELVVALSTSFARGVRVRVSPI